MLLQRRWFPGWFLGIWVLFVFTPAWGGAFVDCPDCPRMVTITEGTYTMGSPASEPERRKFEGPRSDLHVPAFAIGETEVTRDQYAAFVKATGRADTGGCYPYGFRSFDDDTDIDPQASWRKPGFAQTGNHPVTCVSWTDATAYVAWLARRTGHAYRLPSEAEWEYAARAGTTSAYTWGVDENRGCRYANGADASLLQALPVLRGEIEKALKEGDAGARFLRCDDGAAFTSPVRHYAPNAFGLYDMIGNVWELVEDCWYEELPADVHAHIAASCTYRRARGGSWDDFPEELRSARRSRVKPEGHRNDNGFRVALTPSG